jgi:serine/threonine protein kinase
LLPPEPISAGDELAVKIVPKCSVGRQQRSALNREAQIWRRACQATSQAARFIAVEEDASQFYILSEKLDGGNLQQMLDTRGVLAEHELAQVAFCCSQFLADMHRSGLYYGDMKVRSKQTRPAAYRAPPT